jgi:hypothetical protein
LIGRRARARAGAVIDHLCKAAASDDVLRRVDVVDVNFNLSVDACDRILSICTSGRARRAYINIRFINYIVARAVLYDCVFKLKFFAIVAGMRRKCDVRFAMTSARFAASQIVVAQAINKVVRKA